MLIKNNLANDFIRSSKSPTESPIFVDKKPYRNLQLCVDYQDFNNLIIENRYPLPLVEKSTRSGLMFYLARSNQCLSLDKDPRR